MSRLPASTPDVIRALERVGFFLDHSTGSHRYYRHVLPHPVRPEEARRAVSKGERDTVLLRIAQASLPF